MLLSTYAGALLFLATGTQGLRSSLSIAQLRQQSSSSLISSPSTKGLSELFPEYNITVPVDHFHNDTAYAPHTNATFNLRYWFDAKYYKPGGPVYLLSGGETDGADRLPFLQKGIIHQLARATGGVAVVLEHRYYGTSFPFADLSTKSLRFLNTEQALADTAYFASNVIFPGLEHLDLTASSTPYIAYGGSYAGVFVAILRKLYPDVFWGAISSSGVTVAIYDYWQYYEAARLYGPQKCVVQTQKLIHIIDNILIRKRKFAATVKRVFGLGNISHDDDFARVLSWGISGLQNTNWDPELSSPVFAEYCGNVSSSTLLHPETRALEPIVRQLIAVGGYGKQVNDLANHMLNFIGYVRATSVAHCDKQGKSQDECFSNHNSTFYALDDITQTWRAWSYQYCQQWGYIQTGSGVPNDQLPLISRLIDLNSSTLICREAFNITQPPDIESINKHGGFNFSYPRVALLDGEVDPWRAATPHAIGLPDRPNTISEPFWLIEGAVHHWDENGLFKNETAPGIPPPSIVEVQNLELRFVVEWLREWENQRKTSFVTQE